MSDEGTSVPAWVRELVEEEAGPSPLRVGGRYLHPEHGLIRVTGGSYWGRHGLSNFWYWTDECGEQYSGYGERWPEVT